MRAALPLLLAVAVAGCDITGSDGLTFDGVEVEVRGDAALAVEGGRLVVSGLDGSRSGGFDIVGTPDRVDVETDPVTIPAGGRFGIEVEDEDGEDLASIYNEGRSDGRFDIRVAFADALGASAVAVRYKLAGRLVFEIPSLPLGSARTGRRAATNAGTGEGDSGSVHVVRSGGRYIVVSDAEDEGVKNAARRGGCSGFLITPPPPFDEGVGAGVCADWVEVEPLAGGQAPRGRVAVTARGVGSFAVRELAVNAR